MQAKSSESSLHIYIERARCFYEICMFVYKALRWWYKDLIFKKDRIGRDNETSRYKAEDTYIENLKMVEPRWGDYEKVNERSWLFKMEVHREGEENMGVIKKRGREREGKREKANSTGILSWYSSNYQISREMHINTKNHDLGFDIKDFLKKMTWYGLSHFPPSSSFSPLTWGTREEDGRVF